MRNFDQNFDGDLSWVFWFCALKIFRLVHKKLTWTGPGLLKNLQRVPRDPQFANFSESLNLQSNC